MNRLTINLDALAHNLSVINGWMRRYGACWTVVSKVLCGHKEALRALRHMGVQSLGDSRLSNLHALRDTAPDVEGWYLRVPGPSSIEEVAAMTQVSLNSEIETISALNDAARARGVVHQIIIMIELGDLREGILPGSLIHFYKEVFQLPHISVLGIGGNLGCLSGTPPSVDQLMQLVLYRELLELKFEKRLPLISAGSSVVLPLLLDNQAPKGINHFRIGESLFLGTDLVHGGTLPELRDDVILLEAEIAELKKKGLNGPAEAGAAAPFHHEIEEENFSPGQRGYRALLSVGCLDTEISGLKPLDPDCRIAGASSDITVVNLGDNPKNLQVGDTLSFRLDYAALLRLLGSQYIAKTVTPPLQAFLKTPVSPALQVPPVLETLRAGNDTTKGNGKKNTRIGQACCTGSAPRQADVSLYGSTE